MHAKSIGAFWFVCSMEVVCISEGPLREVQLYMYIRVNAPELSGRMFSIHVLLNLAECVNIA